jgi:hypothetical protein
VTKPLARPESRQVTVTERCEPAVSTREPPWPGKRS